MISVVIADDQPLIRSAVRALIEHEEDMQVVAEAATGVEAVECAKNVRPDLVLMDIRMPDGDGIWATTTIIDAMGQQSPRVLILTTFEEDAFIFDALKAGASGFLGKGTDGSQLTEAIRSVAAGDSLLSPIATRRLIETYVEHVSHSTLESENTHKLETLTEREQEILELVGRGLSNSEIADKLFISPLTVKTHINRLMSKLDAHERSQLVIEAYESGMVRPGDVHSS